MVEGAFEPMTRTFPHSLNETMLINPIFEFAGVRQLAHRGHKLLVIPWGTSYCGAPPGPGGPMQHEVLIILGGLANAQHIT